MARSGRGMADPLADRCAYCGSTAVLDDAWFCDRADCWQAYQRDCREMVAYELRTPLTRMKADGDLMRAQASVWGPPLIEIERAIAGIVALL